tara:strand:- start:181 stop:714 length:534 start_codon:yes stop_codon:yes gene_type:complete
MKESNKKFIQWLYEEVSQPHLKYDIECQFPKLFKRDVLEVGKWYKSNKCLFNYQLEYDIYGFFKGEWSSVDERWAWDNTPCRLATPEEVKAALINEAKRRGFKKGVGYISAASIQGEGVCSDTFIFLNCSDGQYLYTSGSFAYVYYNGKWAEIITQAKEMTMSEVSRELGYEVKIIK